VIGDSGEMEIDVPRDRHSSFEPLLVPKWQKKLPGFEDKTLKNSDPKLLNPHLAEPVRKFVWRVKPEDRKT